MRYSGFVEIKIFFIIAALNETAHGFVLVKYE